MWMRTWIFNRFKNAILAMGLAVVLVVMASGIGWSQQPDKTKPAPAEPIHVVADTLETDNHARVAEFSGNVTATQADTVITADHLKIYYGQKQPGDAKSPDKSLDKNPDKAPESSIDQIVAEGNVVIHFGKQVAQANRAVYTTKDRVLVLTGKNAKITSGKDSVSGSKITLYRAKDRIKVESGKGGKVQAVVFSKEKGIQ